MEQDENHVHHFCDLLESYLQSSERTNLQSDHKASLSRDS